MQTSLATITAEAVALPYEDRVELLTVLAKSMSKSAIYTSKKNGTIDEKRCEALIKIAGDKEKVFHRAIDVVPDPLKTLDILIDLGFTRVLTSGQEPTAYEGMELIAAMVKHAKGRIEILPGGGITKKNAAKLVKGTGVNQIHFAALKAVAEPSTAKNPAIYYGGALYPPEDRFETADLSAISEIIGTVK